MGQNELTIYLIDLLHLNGDIFRDIGKRSLRYCYQICRWRVKRNSGAWKLSSEMK